MNGTEENGIDRERCQETIRYRVFGPVEIRDEQGHWFGVRQAKSRALLSVLLANANRLVSRADLERQLWPAAVPHTSDKLVQQYVHRLRRTFPDPLAAALRTRAPGYELVVTSDEIDAHRLISLAADGHRMLAGGATETAAGLFRRALSLCRGPAFADVLDVPAIAGESARLEERRLSLLTAWAWSELMLDNHEAVVATLRVMTTVHPHSERLCGLLIGALCQGGRQVEALAEYSRVRDLLATELAVAPGTALRRLHLAVLRAEPVLDLLRPVA